LVGAIKKGWIKLDEKKEKKDEFYLMWNEQDTVGMFIFLNFCIIIHHPFSSHI
jgi:hypothetical protein